MRTVFPDKAETELKLAFFKDTSRGYFVEVGANEPKNISQTWCFEQLGWTGVLVEPQPQLADELRRQRSARVFGEACSSRGNSGSTMSLYLSGPQSSFDSTLSLAGVKPQGRVEVRVRTLDELLAEAGASRIDFISIDVEGHELDVLDGFDLSRWQPRLLLIEDFLLHLRVHRYLTQHGYRWLRRTGINNWYVPAADLPRLGLDGRWQFFNKFYLGRPTRRLRKAWRGHV